MEKEFVSEVHGGGAEAVEEGDGEGSFEGFVHFFFEDIGFYSFP